MDPIESTIRSPSYRPLKGIHHCDHADANPCWGDVDVETEEPLTFSCCGHTPEGYEEEGDERETG